VGDTWIRIDHFSAAVQRTGAYRLGGGIRSGLADGRNVWQHEGIGVATRLKTTACMWN